MKNDIWLGCAIASADRMNFSSATECSVLKAFTSYPTHPFSVHYIQQSARFYMVAFTSTKGRSFSLASTNR